MAEAYTVIVGVLVDCLACAVWVVRSPARRENYNRPALSAVRSSKDVWKKASQHIETDYKGPRGKQSSNTPTNHDG